MYLYVRIPYADFDARLLYMTRAFIVNITIQVIQKFILSVMIAVCLFFFLSCEKKDMYAEVML